MFFKKTSLAIHITDHALHVAMVSGRRGRIRIESYGELPLTPGIISRGIIENEQLLKEALTEACKKAAPKSILSRGNAVVTLPDQQIYAKVVTLSSIEEKEKEKKLRECALENFPLPDSDLLTTYHLLVKSGAGGDYLLMGLSKTVRNQWKAFFESAQIHVNLFDIEMLAAYRGVFPQKTDEPVALVNIGAERTSIGIFDAAGLRHSEQVIYGGSSITKLITKELGIADSEAEKVKRTEGVAKTAGSAFTIIIKALEPISAAIKDVITEFHGAQHRVVRKIVLIGGTSRLPGIVDYMQSNSDIPINIGRPVIEIKRDQTVFADEPSPEIIGLGRRLFESLWSNDPSFNFNFDNKKEDNVSWMGTKSAANDAPVVTDHGINGKYPVAPSKNYLPIQSRFRLTQGSLFVLGSIVIIALLAFVVYQYSQDIKSFQRSEMLPVTEFKGNVEIEKSASSAEELPRAKILKTPTGWLNVRSGPDKDERILRKVYPGESYPLISQMSGWYHIRIATGTSGWISAEYATTSNP